MVRSYIAATREAIRLSMPDRTRCAVTPHPANPARPPCRQTGPSVSRHEVALN